MIPSTDFKSQLMDNWSSLDYFYKHIKQQTTSVKIKILIGVLVLITTASLVYSNISAFEARKHQAAAMLAQREVENQHKAEAMEANTREAVKQAERMAAKMVKVYMEFEKCKNGEEFNDVALDPSISKNIVPFKE